MAGWQPISTAPKDGEVVMGVWFDDDGSDRDNHPVRFDPQDGGWWSVHAALPGVEVDEPDGWRPLSGAS